VLGEEHHETCATLNNLASLLYARGKHVEAEPLYRKALSVLQSLLGPSHPDVLSALNNLATVIRALGDDDEAEKLYRQVRHCWVGEEGRKVERSPLGRHSSEAEKGRELQWPAHCSMAM
jgi:hypothetical protein